MKKLLEELKKLNLNENNFAIFGSGPLGIRNIRECKDIDVVVKESLWQELLKKHKPIKNKIDYGEHINIGNIEIYKNWLPWLKEKAEELINNADIFDGIRFVKLKYVLKWKLNDERESHKDKNKKDIELINKYLKQNGK